MTTKNQMLTWGPQKGWGEADDIVGDDWSDEARAKVGFSKRSVWFEDGGGMYGVTAYEKLLPVWEGGSCVVMEVRTLDFGTNVLLSSSAHILPFLTVVASVFTAEYAAWTKMDQDYPSKIRKS